MSNSDFDYNELKENIIYINTNFKKKGNEYGIVNLNKKKVELLIECVDLMTSSPEIKPKFHQKIENFLYPRFMEITGIFYTNKSLENEVNIEMDRSSLMELLLTLDLPTVFEHFQSRRSKLEELKENLKNVKFKKYKP